MKSLWRFSSPWHPAHPLWLCGFRPFFLFAALSAPLLVLLWGAFLGGALPVPAVAGGPFVWHAHELVFGFGLAAVAGFALTAVPEFTATPAIPGRTVRRLAGLWLLGRLAFGLSGLAGTGGLTGAAGLGGAAGLTGAVGLALSALAHLGLLAGLTAILAPRLWRDPERRHLAFVWALVALIAVVAGFYADALRGVPPNRWLHAALGVLMMLIVVALSRISMRIVNGALAEQGVEGVEYRARPPRRNLAIFCIGLYTAAEFLAPGERLGGWLALAAAAALCNLLNDWHVGRALFRRWPLMLYGVYVLMAAGYGLIGLALVGGGGDLSGGRHLLTVGALGLNVYGVMAIAGRMHCGLALDERAWVPAGAALLALAALLRALAGPLGAPAMAAAGLAWSLAFALAAWRLGPLFLGTRTDGGGGCDGPLPPG